MRGLLSWWCVAFLCVASMLASCDKSEQGAAREAASRAAPAFTLTDLHNSKVALTDYRGKVVMLEFFATWCLPCRMAAPDLQSVYTNYKEKGFVILAVSLDEGPDAVPAVGSFVKEFGLSFPAVMDDGAVSRQYGVVSIPTTVLIDREGQIRSKHMGLAPDLAARLSREIEALL